MMLDFTLLANETLGEFYQFSRLQAMSEWWHWALMLAVSLVVIVYVVAMYRKDSVDLSRGLAMGLVALRLLAFFGILFYFFNLEKRTERKLVKNSRAILLVDTSQSMGLQDIDPTTLVSGPSRIQQVIDEFGQRDMLEKLREKHDVVVYRFDQDNKPVEVASLAKNVVKNDSDESARSPEEVFAQSLRQSRVTALVAGGFLFVSVFFGLIFLFVGRGSITSEDTSWSLLVSIVSLIIAVVVLAVASLRHPEIEFLAMLGLKDAEYESVEPDASDSDAAVEEKVDVNWSEELAARGLQTRLGEALRYIINHERGAPVAGVVVISDGRGNAGIEYTAGVASARLAEIPVYTIGMGGIQRPLNVRVVDVEAPERVYPGDKFTITGFIQAFGVRGRSLNVKLTSMPTGSAEAEKESVVEDEDVIDLGEEGEIVSVKFEVTPDESGRRTYQLAIRPPAQDHNKLDDSKSANVEVVDRKSRVLLIAGGPSREFRFLRNFLFRDRDTESDVWLQSGEPGISQEADELLFDFPDSTEKLFEYDAIVAFDPDWTLLDEVNVRDLEQWVADQAGGLIVVAGPVHTPQWANLRTTDSKLNTIRSLYPVSLFSSGSATLGLGRFGGADAWPLQFTREGLEAEFLWLEDDAVNSEAAWATFDGVFGYYAVKDAKPGARVFSRFSDPSTAIDNVQPIYMASHFYGAGRVFFQASGEMWRLRAVDVGYFEKYYTKLIRYVAQGRLLRDSKHGVLLVDKDRCLLGDRITVQAMLTDAQNQPLAAPEVTANLIQPDGLRTTLTLRQVQDSARGGTFSGQFTTLLEGDYKVELQPPHAELDELLIREVRVRVPDLEIEKPERNDPVLQDIAQLTGGRYYVGMAAAANRQGAGLPPLANELEPQDQVTYLPGQPDRQFEEQLMMWLMVLICGALCFEWLLRRLTKLA